MRHGKKKFETLSSFLRWRRIRSQILPALLLISSCSVLFSGLVRLSASAQHFGIPGIALSIALMSIHFSYLATMAWQLVYKNTVDRDLGRVPWTLALICCAYVTLAVKSLLHHAEVHEPHSDIHIVYVVPYLLFASTYLIWRVLTKDSLENREFFDEGFEVIVQMMV